MITLEEVKELIQCELGPIKNKIAELQEKAINFETSLTFLSSKYDNLVAQTKSSNGKQKQLEFDLNNYKKDLEEAEGFIEDLAQYLRRDCVEISGVKPTDNLTCKDIVGRLSQEMGLKIDDSEISTAHPLPSYGEAKEDKIIVKFLKRDTRNEFYGSRKMVAGRRASSLDALKEFDVKDTRIYISESLTQFRKKLFGAVNKIKKKLQWKYIWTNNGKIYLKQSDKSKLFIFNSTADLHKFEKDY